MTASRLYPRFLQARLIEALKDTPVVLIHGPRQCGKTTLARQVGDAAGYTYISFDDDVQRDVRDLARISALEALPRLMSFAAGQTGRLLNVSDLAAPFQLSRPTIREYMTLLERVFLLEELTPWHSNRLSRLIKRPKLHLGDTGLACALLNVDAAV